MIRSRQIEKALAKGLRDRGYQITDSGGNGDLYVNLRRDCQMALAGEPCGGRGEAQISLTELANEIDSEID